MGTEQAPLSSGHGPKADRAQKAFGQLSQVQGGIFGVVLCRAGSWTLMTLVDPLQLRILYDSKDLLRLFLKARYHKEMIKAD